MSVDPEPRAIDVACGTCAGRHRLPASAEAHRALEALFLWVDETPAASEVFTRAGGKVLGVLVGDGPAGPVRLQAHSGTIEPPLPGFAPPVLDRARWADAERETIATIARIDAAIAALPLAEALARRDAARMVAYEAAEARRSRRRAARAERLERLGGDTAALVREANRARRADEAADAEERAALQPVVDAAAALEAQRLAFLRERRACSATLMEAMHESIVLTSAGGAVGALPAVFAAGAKALGRMVAGPPTGSGECCAPKLLVLANTLGVSPTGLAEARWEPREERTARHGVLIAPCAERCEPILGHLLCDRPARG